ncbi:MAG: SPOR domain-containing protein [Gemmatimonadaceae bacterium]
MSRYAARLFASFFGLGCFLPAALAAQQQASTQPDTLFQHAQHLVADGHGDAGRAIVQIQLDSAPAGSPRYLEALYYRAALASTAADAEPDLRKIIIEYPLSPWTADALMRLSQLELARGDNTQAQEHLQRVVTEHPDNPSRGRADFWLGRLYFASGNVPAACARLADGLRGTPSTQVELRNQMDYLNQRCAGVDTGQVAATPAVPAATGATPRSTSPASTPPAGSAAFTVQVAAYSTQQAADAMRARLASQGYAARVVGARKPFRVRVGRYATRAQAEPVATAIHGYVTEAEPR